MSAAVQPEAALPVTEESAAMSLPATSLTPLTVTVKESAVRPETVR